MNQSQCINCSVDVPSKSTGDAPAYCSAKCRRAFTHKYKHWLTRKERALDMVLKARKAGAK